MTLTTVHDFISLWMVLFSLAAGLWGLNRYRTGDGIDGAYWGILASAEALYLVEAVLGVILWLSGARPARGIHVLYGAVAVIILPAYYGWTQGRDDRRSALAYGLICLFLAGISLRAIGTAS